MFSNCDEAILRRAPAAAENLYSNAAEGWSRFPGLRMFASLPGQQRVVLRKFRDDLIAVTGSGRVFRIGRAGSVEDVTGVPVSAAYRPVFAETEDRLIIAAGGPLLKLGNSRTDTLSPNAPESTHVAWIDGYTVAIEPFTGRFRHSDPGEDDVWNDLSVFSAEGKPDNLNACVVTPYGELLMAGPDSIEQFEGLRSGDQPFYRRWMTGEGLAYPYTLVADREGTYGVNGRAEFARFQAQVSREVSADIALSLRAVDDWTDAWAASCYVAGQNFIVLQAPRATSQHYGVEGVTFLMDMRRKRWSFLWGFDATTGRPSRWPGWSVETVWGRTFVGVDGGVAELSADCWDNLGQPMRCLIRSAHVDDFGPSRIDNVRLRLRHGLGTNDAPLPRYGMRMRRDNDRWTRWVWRSLRRAGDTAMVDDFGGMGSANTWQMEISCTDPVPFEFVKAEIQIERLSW